MADFETNRIIHGDSIERMKSVPAGSVRMVFADPPYNLQLGSRLKRPDGTDVASVTEDWDKFENLQAYDEFTQAWLSAARETMHEDATIWVSGMHQNIYRIGKIMQDMGFWMRNEIIWRKPNPLPNMLGTQFGYAHETLIWASKSKDSKILFNYAALKSGNDEKQMTSVWDVPVTPQSEKIKTDLGEKLHSTQKPEALLHTILIACTKPGDLVLDPFFGTGTTGVMAKKLHREWIGIEREAAYVKHAQRRIDQAVPFPEGSVAVVNPRTELRVSMQQLVAGGYLRPGERLYSDKGLSVIVMANGDVRTETRTKSIHSLGYLFADAADKHIGRNDRVNGWAYWSVERDGRLVPLDDLRHQARRDHATAALNNREPS